MTKYQKKFTDEFKRQIVALRNAGKETGVISREYDISRTTINTWVRQFANTGSFRAQDNVPEAEKELKQLRKENKHLRMEVDILKQAALILGQKDA